MIAQGHLDVKVAIPVGSSGIYHEKVGIITDDVGNRIAFSGSVNETAGGWLNNRESFKVHRTWCDPREAESVDYDADAFDLFWDPARKPKSIRVYEFPEAARQKLLEFLPKEDRASTSPFLKKSAAPPEEHKLLPDEYRRAVWTFVGEAARLSNGLRAGETTSAVTPWQHQIRTYTRFIREWPCRLLIADEVGLGKTVSAGLILRQAMLAGLAKRTLILTPKSVQIQWQNELYEKFNLNVPIYDGASLCWRPVHGAHGSNQWPLEKPVTRDGWQTEPMVLASSFLMRRSDRQRELLDAADWDFIVLDEAHHARRRGAGTAQEKGPNALLGLMRSLKPRCQSLLLLTATPMQVHPVELWDLIDLLGLPAEWRSDDHVFLKYFQLATGNPSPEAMEYLAGQFRATEAAFGELSEADLGRILTGSSSLKRKRVLKALRDASSIPRKTLDSDSRREAARLFQAVTPLRFRMVRNTRELLRRYKLPIAQRDPREVVVDMSPAESKLYSDVEDFISDSFAAAPPEKRSAVGFVMTVYRRRLASSFEALKRTLIGGPL
jgi:SNF2 family DNA or RNA helicase